MTGFWDRRREIEPEITDIAGRYAWADGRDRYLTFLATVTDESVRDALAEVTDSLGRFECTRPAPPEYFHVTITGLGFPVEDADAADEIPATAVDDVAERAGKRLADVDPFAVELPRLNLFPSVAFCEVRDEGEFERVHRRLLDVPQVPAFSYDGDSYEPHVSLAQFTGDGEFDELVDWMERNREVEAGPLRVDTVSLVAVDPLECFPDFREVERYRLD